MKFNAPDKAARQTGLTLVEGLSVLMVLAVLILMLMPPVPSTSKKRAQRIKCVHDLKQVGLAFRLWANDHEGRFPFASTNSDGALAQVNSPDVFRHYQVMSNELMTPKILICRSDHERSPATNFNKLSNANLSYFVGLDAQPDNPQSILSGDRNVTGGALSSGFLRTLTPGAAVAWTKEIHQDAGNLGLGDGSVRQVSSEQLRQHLAGMTNAVVRLAVP